MEPVEATYSEELKIEQRFMGEMMTGKTRQRRRRGGKKGRSGQWKQRREEVITYPHSGIEQVGHNKAVVDLICPNAVLRERRKKPGEAGRVWLKTVEGGEEKRIRRSRFRVCVVCSEIRGLDLFRI